jgi:predicted dinucleotide-binding enzyme
MRVAVIGTGIVGRTLARALMHVGHDVVVGTRDPEATGQREDFVGRGFSLVPLGEAAADADLVVAATNGGATIEALSQVGPSLDGKIVVDVTNPLDFSAGFPPTLLVKDTDSLAEQIQRTFPQARVVKSLNTMTAAVMLAPVPDSSVFVAGDDAEARKTVVDLLRTFGWEDIIEFSHLEAARGLEMWLPLWVRLMAKLGTAEFNLKIVRPPETDL